MFKKILALLLATMMVLGGMVTVSAAEETAAAEEEVVYDYTAAAEDLAALGIFKGKVIDGNTIDFALEDGVTRLQMALFIARIMTGETNDSYWSKVNDNTTPYDDVVNYFGAVSFADENGIILGKGWIPGVGDNCFDPNGAITYQDAMTMAVRALGYKQLQYPNGFLTVGEELGLTADLEPLAGDAELNRGQMIQILKNMLYVKVEGAASFAEQNFGLEETTYVIVATNLQHMVGASRVAKLGYVELAELNADGTYNYGDYIHLTEAELGLEKGEAEKKLGYSYVIGTYDKYANVYSVTPTATKTVTNYGDNGVAIKAASKYNSINETSLVSIDGVAYNLVKSFSNLNNKSTSVGRNPELIVHSLYENDKSSAFQHYIYDDAFNILDPDTLEISLLYNYYTNTYYKVYGVDVNGNNVYRPATDEDFEDCAIAYATGVSEMYGITTDATEMIDTLFSEMTLIDDNGDGNWDRAVYIPYSVGKYTTESLANAWVISSSADSGSTRKTVAEINDQRLSAVATNTKGEWDSRPRIQQSDLTFDGEGRPASGEYVVYYYNPYSRIFTVVENLGKPVTGTVQNMNQGTYTYYTYNNNFYYYWNNATVTIDGTTYKLGYRPHQTDSFIVGSAGTDLEYINKDLANYGFSEELYTALVGQNYRKLAYIVLAGRLIYADDASTNCNWIAFDYGIADPDAKDANGYVAPTYTGDIMGVDAEGNILVKGYAGSNTAEVIKIGSINGFSYGLLVEDYAALQYQFSGVNMVTNNTAYSTMQKIVINQFFKTLTADNAGAQQYVFIVTGISEDGVYEIYTDLELYHPNNYVPYRQPDTIVQDDAKDEWITFYAGISTSEQVNTDSSNNTVVVLNDESLILVAADGGLYTHTGIPANGDSLRLMDDVTVYALSNDLIFVASKTLGIADIWTGEVDSVANQSKYTYYMVVGRPTCGNYEDDTSVSASYNAEGKVVYTYKNMYNINTGNLETISVVGGLENYNSTDAIFGNVAVYNSKPIGAIYAEKNGDYTLLNKGTEVLTYTDSTYLNYSIQYVAAENSLETLVGVLYNGIGTEYAPVFESAGALSADVVPNTHALLFDGSDDIYDQAVTFAYDYINIDYKNDTDGDGKYAYGLFRLDTNNNASTTERGGAALYYTYEAGKSFQGVAIKGQGANINYNDSKLVVAKQNAIAALELADDANPTAAAVALQAGKDAINAALTVEEVAAQKAVALNNIAKAIADAKQEAADAKTAAENAVDALEKKLTEALAVEGITEASVVPANNTTTLATIKSWVAIYKTWIASEMYADVTSQATTATTWVQGLIDKVAEDAAAAEGAKPAITKVTANSVTLKNISGIAANGIYVWTDNNNGYGDIYAQQSGDFTQNADGSYTATFNYLTGTATATWVNNGTDVTLTFVKKSASGVELDMFTAGTTYRFVINAAVGAGAYNVTAE